MRHAHRVGVDRSPLIRKFAGAVATDGASLSYPLPRGFAHGAVLASPLISFTPHTPHPSHHARPASSPLAGRVVCRGCHWATVEACRILGRRRPGRRWKERPAVQPEPPGAINADVAIVGGVVWMHSRALAGSGMRLVDR